MFVHLDNTYPVLNSGLCGESVINTSRSMSSDIAVYIAVTKMGN